MMEPIRKAAVFGAGVMGAGIAAHLANAGAEVVLLDLDSRLAADGIARQVKAGGFMTPGFAGRVTPGAIGTHLGLIGDADWIVEAVAERLDIKRTLYEAVDAARKPGSTVSSNTSTIRLETLTAGMPDRFAGDFLITHFFNPPRRMRLLELVTGAMTRPEVADRIRAHGEVQLGKGVVECKDTPGFIANRIGNFWLVAALDAAISMGLDVEEADAVLGAPFGIPKTGVFGLLDLVGVDLIPNLMRSLQGALPADDAFHAYPAEEPVLAAMIAAGRTGRKGGGGFFRFSGKTRDVLDLRTGEYRPLRPVASASLDAAGRDPVRLMEHDGPGGRFAAAVMERLLAYTASLIPEIADLPASVDEAMRLGYAWTYGPFELIDRLGAGWLADRLAARGAAVPPLLAEAASNGGFYSVANGRRMVRTAGGTTRPLERPDGVVSLADVKLAPPAWSDAAVNLWDIGDGVACLEFKTKANSISDGVLSAIGPVIERVRDGFRGLVIYSDAVNFSVGADLRSFLAALDSGNEQQLRDFIEAGQAAFQALRSAPFPVVGAPAGYAVGGGLEILLHCDAVQAHAELTAGLVESRVGLVPGWGGCRELLLRMGEPSVGRQGPVAPALAAFEVILPARTSTSAFDAQDLGFLRPSDGISMNRERLLADAKARAIGLADGYRPPPPREVCLSGPSGASTLRNVLDTMSDAGRLAPHDRVVGEALIGVLTGGPSADPAVRVDETTVSDLERDAFLALSRTAATQQRIRHMLDTGKPLRN